MAKKKNKRWFVTAKSESGDDYGVIAEYDHEPSTEELMALTHTDNFGPDGWASPEGEGPGYCGSYLHLLVSRETSGNFSGEYVPQDPLANEDSETPKKPKAKLPGSLWDMIGHLEGLLNEADPIIVDLAENPDLENVLPELQEAFEEFTDSIKWEKYHKFLRLLRERTDYYEK